MKTMITRALAGAVLLFVVAGVFVYTGTTSSYAASPALTADWQTAQFGYCSCGWKDECTGINTGNCEGLCIGIGKCGTTEKTFNPFSDCVAGQLPGHCGQGVQVTCWTQKNCSCVVIVCVAGGEIRQLKLQHPCEQ